MEMIMRYLGRIVLAAFQAVQPRSDPFEKAQGEARDYVRWFVEHAFVFVPAQAIVARHIATFQQFPPRQKPGSFSVEQAMEKLRLPPSSN